MSALPVTAESADTTCEGEVMPSQFIPSPTALPESSQPTFRAYTSQMSFARTG